MTKCENDKIVHRSGFVNIVGNPNVGKSTLMNALVGERLSIITSKAQTTRHRILGIVNGEDFQMVYSDTPGVLSPNYRLQEKMLEFSRSALVDADVLLYVTEPQDTIDRNPDFIEKVKKLCRRKGSPTSANGVHSVGRAECPRTFNNDGVVYSCPRDMNAKVAVLKEHVLAAIQWCGGDERKGIVHSRRHFAASPVFKGLADFKQTRIALLRAETTQEVFAIMDDIVAKWGNE